MTISELQILFNEKNGMARKKLYHLYKEHIDTLFLEAKTYQEKIYLLINNTTISKCPICDNNCRFISVKSGYHLTCCNYKCIRELQDIGRRNRKKYSQEKLEKWNKNISYSHKKRTKNEIAKSVKQRKSTCLEKYGFESPSQVPEIQEKQKSTCMKKYNVEYIFQAEQFKKYGINNNGCKPSAIEKQILRWKNYSQEQLNEITKKRQETRKNKSVNIIQNENKRRSETYKNKSLLEKNKINEQRKQTCLKKYKVEHVLHIPEFRSKHAKSSKFSCLEKKIFELLTNRNINFKHHYSISEYNKNKEFDFAIFDDNDKLICLIDVDGSYWHGYFNDQNGKQINVEPDITRTLFIPENVKFICILENDFENGVRELFSTLELSYDNYVNDLFEWCRNIDFPYPNYSEHVLKTSWSQLVSYKDFKPNALVGDKLIRHFHKSIWHARKGKLSPFEAWYNDDLLMKAIKNRVIYKNNIDPSRILDGFNIAKVCSRITVFKACLARTLIEKYLNEFNTIFDPFSGYSGRMLGTVALGKNYIGQDINEVTVKESLNMVEFLGIQDKVDITVQNVLQSNGNYDCLFTCSPYNLKEVWNENQVDLSCDEWIEICLKNFKCEKYLFVVDKTEKYKNYIVEEIVNKSHFGKNKEYIVLI